MALQDDDQKKVNGAGVITYRVALSTVLLVTAWLVQNYGSRITDQLDGVSKAQIRMTSTLATLSQKGEDTAAQAARNTDRLDDHEHRITVLEARAPAHP